MTDNKNKWERLDAPPPPSFLGQKERDLVKQINDELLERVIGQQIVYYPISLEATNFHPLYGEAINKVFLKPIHVYVLIDWDDNPSKTTNYGVDHTSAITIHFHKRRLTEDQDLYVRVGDFVAYGDSFYEITQLSEPTQLWGQTENKVEILAKCVLSRRDLFDV